MTSTNKPNSEAHAHLHEHEHRGHGHGDDHHHEQPKNVGELKWITLDEEMEFTEIHPGEFKRAPKHDSTVLDVREWSYGPGTTFGKHVHGAAQISRILKGKIRVMVGEEEQVLGAGGYYYTPAGVPHQVTEVLEPTVELLIGIASTDTHGDS